MIVLSGTPAESKPDELVQSLKGLHPLTLEDGVIHLEIDGTKGVLRDPHAGYALSDFENRAKGDSDGLTFQFGVKDLQGTLHYGFIAQNDSKFAHPVFFKTPSPIVNGKAQIPIHERLSDQHDMVGWQKSGFGLLGYRVVRSDGAILYDGRVAFEGKGPFRVAPTIIEGPWIHLHTDQSVTISFETDRPCQANLKIEGRSWNTAKHLTKHVFDVDGLQPDTRYNYRVQVGPFSEAYTFHTAPKPGSRQPFKFGYASDSRGGKGGGERDIYGANAYILKKIMAVAAREDIRFFQFSGDLIDGYLTNVDSTRLQYRNFKRAIEPFCRHFPIYFSMGNHEAVMSVFQVDGKPYALNRFPFETQSAEAIFSEQFLQPTNGPASEDGSRWDPDPNRVNFPSYEENVFHYRHDNVAVVVLNSDYWYAPYLKRRPESGGNLHGYIMDQQVAWLKETLHNMEKDPTIDHIFITMHTPMFPNGGHVKDDMWYGGNNKPRPTMAGEPVEKGIIERRDELLDIIVNKSTKTIALMTGDEHNYCRTTISDDMPRYPENYPHPKVSLSRTIYQVNNGAAGAPYYAQESPPWRQHTKGFTTQNAIVIFEVHGSNVSLTTTNPDTLETIDKFKLR